MTLKRKITFILVITFAFSLYMSAQPKPVDPVNWRKLTPLLVDIEGWKARGEAKGQTMSMQNFKISNASRKYEAGDKSLEIEIIDGSYHPMMYASFKLLKNFKIDTSEEYVKKCNIKEYPGIEQFKYNRKRGTIMVLVADRFLVKLEARNIKDTAELKKIILALDLAELAKLAK